MRYIISIMCALAVLAGCESTDAQQGGDTGVFTYETPEEVAAAIGAKVVRDATDNDQLGRELSATWQGKGISIWVADDADSYEQGLTFVEGYGFPYAAGDNWVITANSQAVADAAAAAVE